MLGKDVVVSGDYYCPECFERIRLKVGWVKGAKTYETTVITWIVVAIIIVIVLAAIWYVLAIE